MSILPPLSSSPLTAARVAELLTLGTVTGPYLQILRWLTWFPLLSVAELARLEQSRLRKLRQTTRSPHWVAARVQELEQSGLLAHVMVNEPGWPPHQHRYFLSDIGLYVFAAAFTPALPVPRLVQAYAVERADLIERLSHIGTHLVLADFSSRLIAESNAYGLSVTSFQQPWIQTDTIFGHRQILRCDAAFLLADARGTEHAFYVLVDAGMFERRHRRILLLRLLNQRDALQMRQEGMPHLLIITGLSRLADWGMLLETVSQQRNTALLAGAITTLDHLRHAGIYGTGWWTFADITRNIERGTLVDLPAPTTSLSELLGPAVSPLLAERFSQRRTFAHLLKEARDPPGHRKQRPLPSYVGRPLTHDIATLRRTSLTDALTDALGGTKREQQEATAMLNLALSATQKELIFWLTHQQLLTIQQLATLHYPNGRGIQSVQKQMHGLFALNLLLPFSWHGSRPWQQRERYLLTEAGLRYSALREGRPVTAYLLPEEQKNRYSTPAFTIQQGTGGLFHQMDHTHGVYSSMTRLIEAAHREHIRVIAWKNAREAIRTYADPFTQVTMQVRPDAELIYQVRGQELPHSILVEYDRATVRLDYQRAKYQAYADYIEYTRLRLPPILVITQHERAARQIRACVDGVDPHLPIVIVLEEHLQRQGLLIMLTHIS